jgi:hypothetical protein
MQYVDMDKEEGKIQKNVIQNPSNRNNIHNNIIIGLEKPQILLQVLLKSHYKLMQIYLL